ncbi:MAG: hypothetical protein HYT12_02410 [Candidatus Liptonbacteria bacterium]|nr:hypothetical protein [Candidatus Liptonbacteria bacterium]
MKSLTTLICAMVIMVFASSASAYYESEQCHGDFEVLLKQGLDRVAWIEPKELFALKTEIQKISTVEGSRTAIVLYGKTIPAAYLIGWNVLSGEEPNKYVTPEARAVFQKTAYQKITRVICPQHRTGWDLKGLSSTIQEVAFWWGLYQDTEYSLAFNKALKKRFDELWNPFFKSYSEEKKQWPYTIANSLGVYTDTTFTVLKISIYINVALWDGDGATYEPTFTELQGRKTYLKEFHFTKNISGDRRKLREALDELGAKYADTIFETFKNELTK